MHKFLQKVLSLFIMLLVMNYGYANSRIKVLNFVKNVVIPIESSLLTVTDIQFGLGERITNIQNGDAGAWVVDINSAKPNKVFLKPTLVGSETNMTVVTTAHTYYFHLKSLPARASGLYSIQFSYTPSYSERLSQSKIPFDYYHWRYTFFGASELVPNHVFDDGRFTYFHLRERQQIPAIFIVDNKEGKESVVNYRHIGDYLVVQSVAPQFTLRSGKEQVACIFNKDFWSR